MKNIFFIVALIFVVALGVVAIGYIFSSQIQYVDLIEKNVVISDEDNALHIVNKEGDVVLEYTIKNWRGQVREEWDDFFEEMPQIGGEELIPEKFNRFSAVSPFPDGIKSIIFAISTHGEKEDYSLFWVLDVGTREIRFFGEPNKGIVGNVAWSPEATHFAYYLNTQDTPGEYLTVDNVQLSSKEFTLSGDAIISLIDSEHEEVFYPEFGNIRWSEDGERVLFSTKTLEEDVSAFWSIRFDGTDLTRER
jgi:hypothetical protein